MADKKNRQTLYSHVSYECTMKKSHYFFSIIIPTLNEEVCIPQLLSDITKQKDKNFEVIVVDATSSDTTKEKIRTAQTNMAVQLIEVKRQHVSYQRNIGAQKAQGKYLVFLDADARIAPLFTKQIKSEILQKKNLLYLPILIPDIDDVVTKAVYKFINVLIETSQSIGKPFSAGGAMIIEKKLFEKLGGFNEKVAIAEDHNLVRKAHKHGIKASILRKTTVVFSPRRMRKEGELSVFYKYFLTTLRLLWTDEIHKKYFSYKMGGHVYTQIEPSMIIAIGKKVSKKTTALYQQYFLN